MMRHFSDHIRALSIISIIALILLSVQSSAQELAIKQSMPLEPAKASEPVIRQDRQDLLQDRQPLSKDRPDLLQDRQPLPKDRPRPLYYLPKDAPRPFRLKDVMTQQPAIKNRIVQPSSLKDKIVQEGENSDIYSKRRPAGDNLKERVMDVKVQRGELTDFSERPAVRQDSPDSPAKSQSSPPKEKEGAPKDRLVVPEGIVLGKEPFKQIEKAIEQDRPRKSRLSEMVLGNPQAVRKREAPDREDRVRETEPENLKEKVYERLKVPKEDRKRALELRKDAERLEKEGRGEEAKKKKKNAEELLPKIKVKSEKSELKPVKEVRAKRPELAKEVKGRLNPDVRVKKRALRIEYKDAAVDQTEFVYSVEPPKGGLTSFELVVEIPKDIAKSVKDIDFEIEPDQVVKDDPVVKWMLKNIPHNTVAEYSFTVDGDVQNFDTLAIAAGEKPGIAQRLLNWMLDLFGVFS